MKQLIIITLIFLVGQVKASGQTYYTEATNRDMLHQAIVQEPPLASSSYFPIPSEDIFH